MELKDLKLNQETIKIKCEFGEYTIKNHLLIDEIRSIANNMLDESDFITREMIKGISLVHFCTDIEVEKSKDGSIIIDKNNYDLYNTNGIIAEIENTVDEKDLYLIDEYIMKEESVNKIVKDFCDNITQTIDDKSKNINLEQMVNDLKTIRNLNDSEK